jgi:alpha-N-arabinofuranosidase
MANVAQLVNNIHSLFLADGDQFVATPNFYIFEMYRAHHNGQSVRLDVQAPDSTFKAGGKEQSLFRVAGSASRNGDKGLTLTLVHTHPTEPLEIAVNLKGGKAATVRQTVLSHERLNAHNTFADPNVLVPRTSETDLSGDVLRPTLAPASVTRFDVTLAS